MNYLRVAFGVVIFWAGALAVLYEPDWVTYMIVASGAIVLLITLLLEGRIRQGDARQVLIGGIGLILGLLLAGIVVTVLGRLPVTAVYFTGGALVAAFGIILLFLVCGYLGAVTGRAVAYELTVFRQPEQDGGSKSRFLVGEKSLIDGRIVKLAESPLLTGEIIIPRFVVDQLNQLAASHVPMEKFRGERGLDSLRRLQQNRMRAVFIRELDLLHGEIEGVLDYAVQHDARIVTQNPAMIKEANRRGIPVVDLNEIAAMLEPEVLSGDEVVVRLVKPGKEKDQAVGYLENGNMVVVEEGREDIGRTVRVAVTGLHQTRAGTLIFARKSEDGESPGAGLGPAAEAMEGAVRS
ncbi:MAG TPA: hypothetical protein VM737_01080 [Gemmatimonadota bacterium]|nr:hypothetical protein [Gemmatimonadota bacterium]